MLQKYHSNSQNTNICDDFNIDLLKVNEVQFNADYFNGTLSAGYIPTITLPTRLSDSSSLIDNIFTDNLSVEMSAFILNNHISDHQPVVLFCHIHVPVHKHKYITIRSKSTKLRLLSAPHLTLSDPGYFVSPACRGWYKNAHPYYFNN